MDSRGGAVKEKLQEYALIAEIISATAVVASFIFVGVQVKQGAEETAENTKSIRVAAFQDLTSEMLRIQESLYSDEGMSGIVRRALDGEELTANENFRLETYLQNVIRHGELAYLQYKQEFITEEQFESVMGLFGGTWKNISQMKRVWNYMPVNDEFHTFIEVLYNQK